MLALNVLFRPARDPGTPRTPEAALRRAVLLDALVTVGVVGHAQNGPGRRRIRSYSPAQVRNDRDWIFSDRTDERASFAFLPCCVACGLDPQAVRERVKWRLV